MARPALLSGAVMLPLERINKTRVVNQLTFSFLEMGEVEPTLVQCFYRTRSYLAVPRQFGIRYCEDHGIQLQDKVSYGSPVQFPRTPTPRPHQVEFITNLVDCAQNYYDFLAKAHTGFGKTISALLAAAELGVTTLIIVDQENLKEQWLEALEKHFGMTKENGHVGEIQGDVCDVEGRSVVIAMIQTLSRRTYSDEVYAWAGLLICDEFHIMGAPKYSRPLLRISAAYRFGVSATPREDSLKKVISYNLGEVRVVADKQHDHSVVYFAQHPTVYSWYANISPKIGRILTEVSEDGSRNLLIATAAKWLFDTGRDTLVLSDRIEQLKNIKCLMEYLGVDPEIMGLYTGNNPQYRYARDARPVRKPYGLEPGAPYTPVSLQLIAKTIPSKALKAVKEESRIQLATYGKAAKAYDVPRLAGGIDATPRGQAEQIQGRVLREHDGKKKPIWITIEDINSYRLVRSFASRIEDYVKSNSTLHHWTEDGELIKCQTGEVIRDRRTRVKQLQSAQIVTNKDGLNTLKMKPSGKVRNRR